MLKLLKNKKGITLIEVILSLTILAMVLIPLSSLFVTTARMNTSSKERMHANQLAQEYMEKLKGAKSLEPLIDGDSDGDGIMLYNVIKDAQAYVVRTIITSVQEEYSKTIADEIPAASFEVEQLNQDSTIMINSNDIYFNGTPTSSQIAAKNEVIIIINYSEQRILTVNNMSQKTVIIYLIKDNSHETVDVDVNIVSGKVSVIKNAGGGGQLDSNEISGYISWIYQITVEVYKKRDDGQLMSQNKLIELKGLKRMN